MDIWKYFDITHRGHVICNPLSVEKIKRLVDVIGIDRGSKVLEIAPGKGEFLIQLAEKYMITGVAVDLSPYHFADLRKNLGERCPNAGIELLNMDGAEYTTDHDVPFDLVVCMGASWIYKGYVGTLKYLSEYVGPGGILVVGEPFWLKKPDPQYLKAIEVTEEMFGTHQSNIENGESLGLSLVYTMVSNHDDWDNYEGLQWWAVSKYAFENPDDEDLPEIMERVSREKDAYWNWGRDTLGWAVYVFIKKNDM